MLNAMHIVKFKNSLGYAVFTVFQSVVTWSCVISKMLWHRPV